MNEHEQEMKTVVEELEKQYSTLLMEKVTPTLIVGTGFTLEKLFEYYCGGVPQWAEHQIFFVLEGRESAPMRVLRTTDLEHGVLIIK